MELNANEILEVLKEKGVDALYHANTVQTSCTFLNQAHLLSRGTTDERDLAQTSQQTDDVDMKFGLWYDVFLDGVDIHSRASQRNFYGPVLFVFDVEVFSQDWLSSLWITKKNPQHWKETDESSDRFFSSVDDFQQNYQKGNFDKIFVLRHIGGVLRLKPYLQKIILDNPQLASDRLDIYSQSVGALKASARIGGINDIAIEPRTCQDACKCVGQYQAMRSETVSKFFEP